MLLGGMSSVVLSYSSLDGGAAQSPGGEVILFSDLMTGRPTARFRSIYKTVCLCVICFNNRSLWVYSPIYLYATSYYLVYIRFCLRRKALRSLRSQLEFGKTPTSDVSQRAREKPDFGH